MVHGNNIYQAVDTKVLHISGIGSYLVWVFTWLTSWYAMFQNLYFMYTTFQGVRKTALFYK